jgi:6,7-dimethyl-8-ribityllumazine synthase
MELDKKKKIRINGEKLKIAIILPYFNESIGLTLLENAKKELLKNKVHAKNIKVIRVAGALEIPFACQKIIKTQKPDAIIALGIIIRGETSHFDLVTKNTYQGIMEVQLKNQIPISFGVLTCENTKQAKERASAKGLNKGAQAAQAALIQTTF